MGIFLYFELVWVCPIQKGKILSFPYYQWIQSPQDYHEIKTASTSHSLHREAQVLLIYWPHAHIWNRSTRGKGKDMKAWPLSSHYQALSYFNLSLILTFRILCFLKKGRKEQKENTSTAYAWRIISSLCSNTGNIFMSSVAICLLELFLEFSEDGTCSVL